MIKIKPGFTNRPNFGVLRQLAQVLYTGPGHHRRVFTRMHPYTVPNICMRISNASKCRAIIKVHCNCQKAADPGFPGCLKGTVEIAIIGA
jgi:hypothetical protein